MVEPLGKRDEIIDASCITRWHLTQLLEQPKERDEDEERSPFVWRNDLNAKIAIWRGNITQLNVHAITHTTNEHMNEDDNPVSQEIFRNGGSGLVKEVKEEIKVCKTGEAKLTKGHNLPARFVIHSVGPRYNVKYVTAAESALYSCYRGTLQLCKETKIRSLGLGPIHTSKRAFPAESGAHIAIRTVRRFLEKHTEDLDLVIFVCNNDTIEIYRQILPLYFPRNSQEEDSAIDLLPKDIGNEDGEPVIQDRQIRIMDKPIFAAYSADNTDFEQTIDLNKEFAQSMALDVGHHPFAEMEDNPDLVRSRTLLNRNHREIKEMQTRKRYEKLLRRAKKEDLTEIAALHCLYRTGIDRMGRPVVVFVGRNYPALTADPEKTLLYLIRVMDEMVESDYVVVYFHTGTSGDNQPSMTFFKTVYSLLDQRYKKNLKYFYIIHPTWWSKLATWFFTTFTASDIKKKVHSMKGVQFLFTRINPDQIDVPQFVQDYDIRVNGPRYVVPEPDDL